jgi:hypothetical protein
MNFSTKNKSDLKTSSAIKKPINLKAKNKYKKTPNREDKRKKYKIIFEENDAKSSSTEENIDFEAFFDEEQKQKEDEKQREFRRIRLGQIKKMNENFNKDNVDLITLKEENKDEIRKVKLSSKNDNNHNNKIKDDEKSLIVKTAIN